MLGRERIAARVERQPSYGSGLGRLCWPVDMARLEKSALCPANRSDAPFCGTIRCVADDVAATVQGTYLQYCGGAGGSGAAWI